MKLPHPKRPPLWAKGHSVHYHNTRWAGNKQLYRTCRTTLTNLFVSCILQGSQPNNPNRKSEIRYHHSPGPEQGRPHTPATSGSDSHRSGTPIHPHRHQPNCNPTPPKCSGQSALMQPQVRWQSSHMFTLRVRVQTGKQAGRPVAITTSAKGKQVLVKFAVC